MKLRITVEGKAYEVDVEVLDSSAAPAGVAAPAASPAPKSAPAPAAAPAPASAPAAGSAGAGDVQSPIAGSVVKVAVKVGDSVALNDTLLVLEAMKMESNVASPIAGTVREVCANAGDSVQAGQVLVRVAPA